MPDPLAIETAAVMLSTHNDPAVRGAAEVLLRALGVESDGIAARRAERDRQLQATGLRAGPLSRVLTRYRSTTWPRTRFLAENPHRPGELRWRLWAALAAVDRDLSERQLHRIISDIQH